MIKNKAFKRIIFKRIVAFILLAIIFMFAYLKSLSVISQSEYESNLLINLLGRQRMLTQKMAKDANRIYAITQAIESGNVVSDELTLINALKDTRASLISGYQEFNVVIDGIIRGEISIEDAKFKLDPQNTQLQELISETNLYWQSFGQAVNTVVESKEIDQPTTLAIRHINENNMPLMQLSDDITNVLIDQKNLEIERYQRISFVILFTAILILLLSMAWLYQFIIYPLDELYHQLSITGLEQNTRKKYRLPIGKSSQSMVKEVSTAFEKLRSLINLIENVNQNVSFEDVLKYIYKTFSSYVPYSYIGIALLKEKDTVLEAAYTISDDSLKHLQQKMDGVRTKVEESSLKEVLISGKARLINNYGKFLKDRPVTNYSEYVYNAGIRSSITLPIQSNDKPLGVIFFSSTEKNAYNSSHLAFLKTLTNSLAISFEKSIFINQLLYSSILAMARLTEARDEDTGDHLERIKSYTRALAIWLRDAGYYSDILTTSYINDLSRFSPLHDIGKVGIRDGILLKPGKLTEEEFAEMKKHTEYGADVLNAAEQQMKKTGRSMFKIGIEIVSGHHEKWDGSGYPYGLKEFEIPLSARIVSIVDVFDALTSKRPYKEEYPLYKAVKIMSEGRAKHFDPEILDVFLADLIRLEETFNIIREKSEVLSFY